MSQQPLHQPPNPDDLRQNPPAGLECARTRSLMRDFVDGELGPHNALSVEEHVHGCRACALALARSEHELMQVRRWLPRTHQPAPAGFKAQVLRRLLEQGLEKGIDQETEFVPPEIPAAPREVAPAVPAPPAPPARTTRARGGFVGVGVFLLSMPGALMLGVMLLAGLVLVQGVGVGDDGIPQRMSRLVITGAVDTYSQSGSRQLRLHSGDGLGDDQMVWVGVDGAAEASWHDKSDGPQPAATFQLGGNAAVRLRDGEPVLVNGKLRIVARRPFGLVVDDGSRLELGVGEYILTADSSGQPWNPSAGAPKDLRVGVQVLDGQGARILRDGQEPFWVGPGTTGIYADGEVYVQSGSPPDGPLRGAVPMPPPGLATGTFGGRVLERSSLPVGGAEVSISYGGRGAAHSAGATVAESGFFLFETGASGAPPLCDSKFAILQVQPPSHRAYLGLAVPEAYRLAALGNNVVQLAEPVVLDISSDFVGMVLSGEEPVAEAMLMPCVVDELFGCVLPWPEGQVTSDSGGRFRLPGLPAHLPAHQRLVVVLSHPDFDSAAYPVPVRRGVAALEFPGRCVARTQRSIQLHSLPANATVQIWQDVPGLPPGSAARLRTVQTDPDGRVESLLVGRGRLFLRNSSPSHVMLRELILDPQAAVPTFRPAPGVSQRFDAIYEMTSPLPGSDLAFAGSYRYQKFVTRNSSTSTLPTATSQTGRYSVYLTDALTAGYVSAARVFALQTGGPRVRSNVRFLGFSSMTGVLVYDRQPDDVGLFAIGADGATAMIGLAQLIAHQGLVEVSPPGRVLVDPALRPPFGPSPRVLVLDFEPMGATAGLSQRFVRFATDASGWEIGDLPVGTYRVSASGFVVEGLVVTSGGVALLR